MNDNQLGVEGQSRGRRTHLELMLELQVRSLGLGARRLKVRASSRSRRQWHDDVHLAPSATEIQPVVFEAVCTGLAVFSQQQGSTSVRLGDRGRCETEKVDPGGMRGRRKVSVVADFERSGAGGEAGLMFRDREGGSERLDRCRAFGKTSVSLGQGGSGQCRSSPVSLDLLYFHPDLDHLDPILDHDAARYPTTMLRSSGRAGFGG